MRLDFRESSRVVWSFSDNGSVIFGTKYTLKYDT
jgi:hypothetical protein